MIRKSATSNEAARLTDTVAQIGSPVGIVFSELSRAVRALDAFACGGSHAGRLLGPYLRLAEAGPAGSSQRA